jgi:hypothetical protein
MMADERQQYLGDGVYASFDGYQIWLARNDHANRVIALEPAVFEALIKYAANLKKGTSSDSKNAG